MKLFTKDIDKKLFQQFDLGSDLENQVVVAKIFNPYGRGTWYIINSDPNDPDYLWCIADFYEVELGSVLRSELEGIRISVGPYKFPLERDLSFNPVNAAELLKNLFQGKTYAKGGKVNSDKADKGKHIEGEWVVYNPVTDEILAIKKSGLAAKREMQKLWLTGKYDELGTESKAEFDKYRSVSAFAKGGQIDNESQLIDFLSQNMVYHGGAQKLTREKLKNNLLYLSTDYNFSAGYSTQRSGASEPQVTSGIIFINHPAPAQIVEHVASKLGIDTNSYSQAELVEQGEVANELRKMGYDGALRLWDFGFESDFGEALVDIVFDAKEQFYIGTPEQIAQDYFEAKRSGTNPQLVKTIDELISGQIRYEKGGNIEDSYIRPSDTNDFDMTIANSLVGNYLQVDALGEEDNPSFHKITKVALSNPKFQNRTLAIQTEEESNTNIYRIKLDKFQEFMTNGIEYKDSDLKEPVMIRPFSFHSKKKKLFADGGFISYRDGSFYQKQVITEPESIKQDLRYIIECGRGRAKGFDVNTYIKIEYQQYKTDSYSNTNTIRLIPDELIPTLFAITKKLLASSEKNENLDEVVVQKLVFNGQEVRYRINASYSKDVKRGSIGILETRPDEDGEFIDARGYRSVLSMLIPDVIKAIHDMLQNVQDFIKEGGPGN